MLSLQGQNLILGLKELSSASSICPRRVLKLLILASWKWM